MGVPRVLVLLAAYNGADWLAEQINSVLQQTNIDVHILVSDDGSSDSSLNLLRSFEANDSRLRLFSSSVSSGSAGNNFRHLIIKCDSSGFDYVAFCDQDDVWCPDKLERAVEKLKSSGSNGYSAPVIPYLLEKKLTPLSQCRDVTGADFIFEGAGQGCTFVLPISDFQTVKKFCKENPVVAGQLYFHDWLVYLLIRTKGGIWFFDQQPVLYYRQHASNEIGARGSWNAVVKRWSKISNGWYKKQIIAACAIYRCAKSASDTSDCIEGFSHLLGSETSIGNQLKKAIFIARNGRRKTTDRCVLVVAALLGKI